MLALAPPHRLNDRHASTDCHPVYKLHCYYKPEHQPTRYATIMRILSYFTMRLGFDHLAIHVGSFTFVPSVMSFIRLRPYSAQSLNLFWETLFIPIQRKLATHPDNNHVNYDSGAASEHWWLASVGVGGGGQDCPRPVDDDCVRRGEGDV